MSIAADIETKLIDMPTITVPLATLFRYFILKLIILMLQLYLEVPNASSTIDENTQSVTKLNVSPKSADWPLLGNMGRQMCLRNPLDVDLLI